MFSGLNVTYKYYKGIAGICFDSVFVVCNQFFIFIHFI